MTNFYADIALLIGSWWFFVGAVYKGAGMLSDTLNDSAKHSISNSLKNINGYKGTVDIEFLNYLFNFLFTKRHLSFACFFRSGVISLLLVTLFVVILRILFNYDPTKMDYDSTSVLVAFVLVVLPINLLADYLSLLETRVLISKFPNNLSLGKLLLIIILDFVFTLALYVIFGSLSFGFVLGDFTEFAGTFYDAFFWTDDIFSIMLISSLITTFFTSIWIWIFFFWIISVSFLNKISSRLLSLKSVLDIDKKPIKSIALFTNVVITIIYSTAIVIYFFT